MNPNPSQYDPGHEIPERSWAYRFAKRLWFNDYGAYGTHFRQENWQRPAPVTKKLHQIETAE